jgi:group II intron reverse transcriptase/maturase
MERRGAQSVDRFSLSPDPCKAGPFKGFSGLDGIHSAAQRLPEERRLTNLRHHVSGDNLRVAFRQLDGRKAVGIDRTSKDEYSKRLEEKLPRLTRRLRAGTFHPKPSREVLIPKTNGGWRPLAVGTVEDRMVQTLLAKIYEAVFEPIFHRHSFGFRPGKSCHGALARVHRSITERKHETWVVEMDIEKFFNTMDHGKLMTMIRTRIGDKAFLRLTENLLKGSTLGENGEIRVNEVGAPQGSPLSPVLANIYLHYALDEWFNEHWEDRGAIVRYADDALFVFNDEQTAQAFRDALQSRLGEFGLKLNLDKSGIRRFDSANPDGQLPFLGFVFYWGRQYRTRKRYLKVKTAPKRVGKCIEQFTDWIKFERNRKKLNDLWTIAAAKLRGHYNYYGVSCNGAKLNHFYYAALGALFKWLNRRSQKRSFSWENFQKRLMFCPLPKPTPGALLVDITNGSGTENKHKLKSRMRKLRTSGSVRSSGWQQPLFT